MSINSDSSQSTTTRRTIEDVTGHDEETHSMARSTRGTIMGRGGSSCPSCKVVSFLNYLIIYITTTTSPTAIGIEHSRSFSAVVTFSSRHDHQNRPVYGLPWTAATNHRHNPSNERSRLLWACSGRRCHHDNSATS